MSARPSLADIGGLLRSRRSVRRFRAEPVLGRAELTALLELATWSPSAHNRQPWRFAVLTDPLAKDRLASAMGDRLRADRTRDGAEPPDIDADARRSYGRLTQAPALIVVCLTLEGMDSYPDQRRGEAERTMAVQSAAMAGHSLMLAAHAAGWGACWMCAPLFAPEEVRSSLGLPADWEPQGAILLGVADSEPPARPRRPVSDVTRWI